MTHWKPRRKLPWLLAAVAVVALTAPAEAASRRATVPAKQAYTPYSVPSAAPIGPAYVADPAVPVWAGAYGGAHIGGVWSDFSNAAPVAGPSGGSSSATGGFQIGYNWQNNRFVYGVEGDWSLQDLSSRNGGAHFNEPWQATARGRLGYTWGPWLPYVTGGVAFTQARSEFGAGSADGTRVGFAAGGGVEKYFAPRWSGKLEYLYTDVPKSTDMAGATPVEGGSGNSAIRFGVNYHF
ncbi:MAG TPA: outer membrane protein [Alphaproteobacteria bacterium]|nr:outer membrane protein [Alphaproteobacteria bacterium]